MAAWARWRSLSAFGIWIYLTILYFNTPGNMQQRPLFTFAGFILIAGILMFIGGFLAELVVSQSDRVEDMERTFRERESVISERERS